MKQRQRYDHDIADRVQILVFLALSGLLFFSSISANFNLAEAQKWTKKADMPTQRSSFSTAVINGKIYAIGGIKGGGLRGGDVLKVVEEYDPLTDTWTKKADMPNTRANFSTAVVNGKIYVIGGAKDGVFSAAVDEYDPLTDSWTKKAEMPTARFGLATSAVDGKIYAIGGAIGVAGLDPFPTAIVEEYDPATNKWTKKANMPTPRSFLSASVVAGKIYAIAGIKGGLPHPKAVEEYDPKTDTWTKKAEIPTARYALATSAVGGRIYAIGGATGLIVDAQLSPKPTLT